ncbi:MAG: hypothetical protein ACE5FI_16145, partial [Anaerolineales bacterium]
LERAGAALAVLWIVAAAAVSTRDYFVRWANDPEVRGAYHATLLQGLDTLSAIPAPRTTLISSPLPGVAHDPYIGELSPAAPTHDLRFANTSNALLLPSVDSALLYTSETVPAHPALDVAVMQSSEFHTRPDDLDSKYVIATFSPRDTARMFTARVAAPDNDTVFGHAVRLEGAAWLRETYHAGETAELLTVWRVVDSAGVGPPAPPAGRSDVVLFTHVLDAEGALVAQRDELGAPSWQWQTGDTIVQIHALPLPAAMEAATYRTVVGIYDHLSGVRLATESGADIAEVLPLRVVSP